MEWEIVRDKCKRSVTGCLDNVARRFGEFWGHEAPHSQEILGGPTRSFNSSPSFVGTRKFPQVERGAAHPSAMDLDDDDLDFAAAFEEFNMSPDVAELSQHISDNLRAQAGIGGKTIVHEGEADEGRITWEAPMASGIKAAAEEAEELLWADLAPEEGPGATVSENMMQAREAVQSMEKEEAAETAILFDKLAAHGKGFTVLDLEEFQSLMLKLARDDRGRKLLQLLLSRVPRE